MVSETPTYDLVLLLSTNVEEERRAQILADVEAAIEREGAIVHKGNWGRRPLAYQIDHQGDAEYQLLQFTGPPALLESLGHSLGITDGVLRFRIIKVIHGTPPPPSAERMAASAPAPTHAAEPAASTAGRRSEPADAGDGSE